MFRNSLVEYEIELDAQRNRVVVEDDAVVCDLGTHFRVSLGKLWNEDAIIDHARQLQKYVASHSWKPKEIIERFVNLVNLDNKLGLRLDAVVAQAMQKPPLDDSLD